MRQIGAIKAPPRPTSNARVFCGQTQTPQKYRHKIGAVAVVVSITVFITTVAIADLISHSSCYVECFSTTGNR